MTVSSPNVERKASVNPPDYADLFNKKPLPCKGFTNCIGIIRTSA
jgi:hypothetical protein